MPTKPRGRPQGVMLHAEAFEAMLSARNLLKKDVAADAAIAPTYLADLLALRGGASLEVAQRLAQTLGVKPGALFPELAAQPWTSPIPNRDAKRAKEAA